MAANESDKDHLDVVIHLDDQAVFVAADVEDNPVVRKKTGTGKLGLHLLWMSSSGGRFGLPLCAQADRHFVISFPAHGPRSGSHGPLQLSGQAQKLAGSGLALSNASVPPEHPGARARRSEQIAELLRGQSCIASNGTHGDGIDRVMPWNHQSPLAIAHDQVT